MKLSGSINRKLCFCITEPVCSVLDTKGEGFRLSSGMIGGIVGGLLFLVVAFILALIAVKIFNKRKEREKAMRYGKCK